jgi:predicted PurR-regulated permease PerM
VRRGMRRGGATGIVLFIVLVLTIGFIVALASVFIDQITALLDDTPRYVRKITQFLNDTFGVHLNPRDLIHDIKDPDGNFQEFTRDLANSAPDIGVKVLSALLQISITLIFAFYLTAEGPRFRRTICARLSPERQEVVLETWELATDKTGAYLYSRIILAAVSAAATWLFLFLIGVPSPLALGIFVGVTSQFIPTIGTYIAMVLPALVAIVNEPSDTLWVIVFLTAYNQFENYVLGPRIARFTLKIHPAVTIGAVFAGGLLFGGVGAVLALPAAAVIQALLSTYMDKHRVIDSELTREPRVRKHRFRRSGAWIVKRIRRLRRRRADDTTSG